MMKAGKVLNRFGIIDLETGQVIEPVKVYLLGPDKRDVGFAKVFHAFTETILADREVMKGPYRLLLYIMSKKLKPNSLEFEFYMTHDEVCKALSISDRTYRRWLSVLLRKGYVKKVNINLYRLRPYSVVIGAMADVEDEDF